jgi:uncharacterized protein VirK/YbjX
MFYARPSEYFPVIDMSATRMVLTAFVVSCINDVRSSAWLGASTDLLGPLRGLLYPTLSMRTIRLFNLRQQELELKREEFFNHLRHQFYLSKRLSTRQRLEVALHHHDYEFRRYSDAYRAQVYRNSGLILWQADVDDTHFCIRLTASRDLSWEGDLSVTLHANGARLCTMSFTYVDSSLFAAGSTPMMFVTRNQSDPHKPEQLLFRQSFRHTTPPYFCLAALFGIAQANGMDSIAAVRHQAQIACTPDNQAVLKNSYDEFWRAFRATELDDQSFVLPVPMTLTPLPEIKAKHRGRAVERRRAWSEVSISTRAVTTELQTALGSGPAFPN